MVVGLYIDPYKLQRNQWYVSSVDIDMWPEIGFSDVESIAQQLFSILGVQIFVFLLHSSCSSVLDKY